MSNEPPRYDLILKVGYLFTQEATATHAPTRMEVLNLRDPQFILSFQEGPGKSGLEFARLVHARDHNWVEAEYTFKTGSCRTHRSGRFALQTENPVGALVADLARLLRQEALPSQPPPPAPPC